MQLLQHAKVHSRPARPCDHENIGCLVIAAVEVLVTRLLTANCLRFLGMTECYLLYFGF